MAIVVVITLCMISTGLSSAYAQQSISSSLGLVPYPANSQSVSQQNQDEGECDAWAKQQTGIDLVAVANTPPHLRQLAAENGSEVPPEVRSVELP